MSQYNDCKLLFYQNNGATSSDIQDAAREWLILEGFPPQHNADMFFNYLESQGYEGSYSDMKTKFWKDNNCLA